MDKYWLIPVISTLGFMGLLLLIGEPFEIVRRVGFVFLMGASLGYLITKNHITRK